MTNHELIEFLYMIVQNLKKEENSNANKLDHLVWIAKERLDPN